MNPERLLKHFEAISEAEDAVPRLRQFILDIAVRGKLVEQNSTDEPADELLRRIQTERARLVKAGSVKEPPSLSPLKDTEIPYSAPSGWKWIRLGDSLNNHLGGGTPSKTNAKYWGGNILWASVKDIGKTKYVHQTIDRITPEGLKNSTSNLIPEGNLIVVTRMGLGKVSINRAPMAINQDLRALFLSSLASIDYYYVFFKTATYEGSGLTVKGIKVEQLLNFPFPLPPLAEQHRIVAKVDELMALCDELEAARTKRETRRDHLVAATLHRLNKSNTSPEAGNDTDFKQTTRFYFNHLPRLTTRPEHIKQLRQAVLNLAVCGKLDSQNPSDESAEELLNRIKLDKATIGSGQNIRAKKESLESSDRGNILSLPTGWALPALGELVRVLNGRAYAKNELLSSGVPVLRVGNLFTSNRWYYSNLKLEKDKYCDKGDLLFAWSASFGPFIWPGPKVIYHYHIWKLDLYSEPNLNKNYLYWFLLHKTQEIKESGHGVAMVHMTKEKMEKIAVPLPPLAEQHRIVAKVNELMALCDELEAQLTTTATTRYKLLEATLHEALAVANVV